VLTVGSHRFKSKTNTDIVLVPLPTDDPNDLLNWLAWKKNMALRDIFFLHERGFKMGLYMMVF
jgi:hypothetical protein